METLYDVLGVHPDDNAESLKNAFRKAAKANHPDRHACDPEAAERFTRIVTAYDTLRDPKRRAAYDRLLEYARGPLRSKAKPILGHGRRTTFHPAYQFAFYAIAGVVVGMLAGGGYLLFVRIYGITGDMGRMTAGQSPPMVAFEPAKGADTAGQTTRRSARPIDTGPKATAGDPGRDHAAKPAEQPQSTAPKTTAMSNDEICKRDAAQLEHLRISQERDEVIRFERELGCEKLHPQVSRLRESVDPPIDPTGLTAAAGDTGRDHGREPAEQPRSTEPKTTAMSQDEICKRDAAQLARLRSQEHEVRELDCEKLPPQVIGLQESVAAPIDRTGSKAASGDTGRSHGAEPPEQSHSTEPKSTAMSQDEICKRDAAQLAYLRINQERDDVIRLERELGCEKLRPQVTRLRESVDPQ